MTTSLRTRHCEQVGPRMVLLLALLLSAASVQAQQVDRQMAACMAIADDAGRLACFEGIARGRGVDHVAPTASVPPDDDGSAASAHAQTPEGAVSREDRAASFGEEAVKQPDKPAPLQAIESRIADIDSRPHGERIFHLTNGQIWVELEPGRGRLRADTPVRIERTLLGGYMLQADGRPGSRVERIK